MVSNMNDVANRVMGIVDLYKGTAIQQDCYKFYFKFQNADNKQRCKKHLEEIEASINLPKTNGAHGLELCVEILC